MWDQAGNNIPRYDPVLFESVCCGAVSLMSLTPTTVKTRN